MTGKRQHAFADFSDEKPGEVCSLSKKWLRRFFAKLQTFSLR